MCPRLLSVPPFRLPGSRIVGPRRRTSRPYPRTYRSTSTPTVRAAALRCLRAQWHTPRGGPRASGQDLLHHAAMHVRQAVLPPLIAKRQPLMVHTQTTQDRCVQVVEVHRVAASGGEEGWGLALDAAS